MSFSIRTFCNAAYILALCAVGSQDATAQDHPIAVGEALVTQFSGTVSRLEGSQSIVTTIDSNGPVLKAIDLRAPGRDLSGQHWLDEPQRALARSSQIGQVFGIAIDDASPANIYLGATSAFGLHRTYPGGSWMDGQWGPGGGPGTIWKLDALNGYAPEIFATVNLGGRQNSGPGIGNIAFDPHHRQLFVSDLESGMIHAYAVDDGAERDRYDHGVEGRSGFLDVTTDASISLPTVEFAGAAIVDSQVCGGAVFASAPECWSLADFRRRVWGLAIHRDAKTGEIRLYYALWSNTGFGNTDFGDAEAAEKTNSVWSIALDRDGRFERDTIRREFLVPALPDEENHSTDTFAISDIAFPKSGDQALMLLGQYRGIATRFGTGSQSARAPWPDAFWPNYAEAPDLRWFKGPDGRWNAVDVPDQTPTDTTSAKASGWPVGRNSAGGVDFGFGFREGAINEDDPAGTAWLTANHMCTVERPCLDTATGDKTVVAEVHGLIGIPDPGQQLKAAQEQQFVAIDIDVNVGDDGAVDLAELSRRNAGGVGDVEVYVPYEVAAAPVELAGAPQWPEDAADQPWWPASPAPADGSAAGGAGTLAPDLVIQKAVPFACVPGKACSFVMVVTNIGDAPYAGPLRVTDGLANQWVLAGFGPAGSTWVCAQFGANVICDKPDFQLAPGAVDVVTIDVNVPAAQVPGTIHNCAAIQHAADTGDKNQANDEGCADLSFDGVAPGAGQGDLPDLAMSKQTQGVCVAGQPCDFVVQFTNAGTVPFDGVLTFVDLLPPGWSYAGKASGWWCMLVAGGGDRFSCSIQKKLDPGSSLAAVVSLRPPADATGNYENCAFIDWTHNEQDARPENDRACVTVTLQEMKLGTGVDLKLEKNFTQPSLTGPLAWAQSGCQVGAACRFSFDATITNVGTESYFGPIIFDDLMPLGWTYEGASGSQICETKGSFLSCGFGAPRELAPGQNVKASVTLRSAPLDAPATFVVRNCASLSKKMQGDQNEPNDSDCDETTVVVTDGKQTAQTGTPDIEIIKSANSPCLYNIEACQFTISLRNKGTADFDGGILLADKWLPGGWAVTPPADWKCSQPQPDVWNCGAWIKVPAGQTVDTQWSFQAPAGFNPSGDPLVRNNCILPDTCVAIALETGRKGGPASPGQTVSSGPGGVSVAGGGTAVPGTGQQPPAGETADILGDEETGPDLKITKNLLTTCEPGKRCDFVLNVTGVGDDPFNGNFVVSDTLPAGWTFAGGGKLGLWSCEKAGNDTVCTYDASKSPYLPAGGFTSSDSLGFGLQLNIPASQPSGLVENCASIRFLGAPPKKGSDVNHTDCATVVVGYPPKLTISKRFDKTLCVPGETCDFTITVRNEGKGAYEGLLEVWDLAEDSDAIQVQKIDADPALNCGREGTLQVLLCTTKTSLKPGESKVIRVSATIDQMFAGSNSSIENCAQVELYDTDPGSWDYERRLSFVRSLLIADKQIGYDLTEEPGKPLNISEITAVMAYKKDHDIKNDAGNLDETGEITDALLKSALPTFRDAAFDDDKAERNKDGSIIRKACSKVSLRPNLAMKKTGPSDAELLGGSKSGYECRFDHQCPFAINITATNGQAYDGPITVREELPTGWKLAGWFPTAPGGWSCQGSNPVTCTIAEAHIPAGGSIQLDLSIEATTAWYQWVAAQPSLTVSERRHPWIENCSYLLVDKTVIKQAPYASCYKARLSMDDLSDFGYEPLGTGTCTPPNCSFYQFTATLRDEPYNGPLSIDGTLPRGSRFDTPTIRSTANSCPASAWSCSNPQGNSAAFSCKVDDCLMRPDEQIIVRLEGSVAPDLSEPPDTPQEKIACSTIEWVRRSMPGSIEQQPGPLVKQACFTTTVLARPKPQPCPTGQEYGPAGNCVPIATPLDLAITKKAIGDCNGKDTCRFQLVVGSKTGRPYAGKVALRDTFSVPGATLQQVSGAVSCSQSGQQVTCIAEPGGLASGKQLLLTFDIDLPKSGGNRQFENCAELYLPDVTDNSELTRDEVRMIQRALDHLGFDPGPIDGKIGRTTRSAASRARASLGLEGGTVIDRTLLATLLGEQEAEADINPDNNRACVRVTLPECGPGYSAERATGKCVCVSPRVERNGACVVVKEPKKPVAKPQPSTPKQKTPTPQPAQPRPAPFVCIGGVPVGGICVCPPRYQPEPLAGRNGFRCVPLPVRQTAPQPAPQPAPIDVCPPGQVYSHQAGRCISKQQPAPTPAPQQPAPLPTIPPIFTPVPQLQMICPQGTKWVPEARQCIKIID